MASFLTSLWESIFTPGPTPTLLIATNASFSALQLLLLVLLVTTQSIHFAVLSVLCGGLWYAINWFSAEVQAAQTKEAEEKKKKTLGAKEKERERRRRTSPDPGSDTETETEARGVGSGALVAPEGKVDRRKAPPKPAPPTQPSQQAAGSDTSPDLLQPSSASNMSDSGLMSRRRSLGDSTSGTDSEWEKISDQEGT